MSQTITDRIDAEIAAHGRPPVSDGQIAAVLASVRTAFEVYISDGENTRVCFGSYANRADAEEARRSKQDHFERYTDGNFGAYVRPVAAAVPRTAPIQEARDHIRAALRIAWDVEKKLQLVDCTGGDEPREGVAIARELALALDALKDAVTR